MSHPKLTLLSYNIHKGFSQGNATFVLGQIRSAIRRIRPDIVFLQEVLGEHKRHAKRIPGWPENSQFEFLADGVWPHFAYGRNAVYTAGHHGNAILSKYPFSDWDNTDISSNRFEKRGILHGVIPLPHSPNPLHVYCLHLNVFGSGRRSQIRALCAQIKATVPPGHPLVIGGDFNDRTGRATAILNREIQVREVFRVVNGRHARSFPAWSPIFSLDRIYFRGLNVVVAKLLKEECWRSLSDHLPLYCQLSI